MLYHITHSYAFNYPSIQLINSPHSMRRRMPKVMSGDTLLYDVMIRHSYNTYIEEIFHRGDGSPRTSYPYIIPQGEGASNVAAEQHVASLQHCGSAVTLLQRSNDARLVPAEHASSTTRPCARCTTRRHAACTQQEPGQQSMQAAQPSHAANTDRRGTSLAPSKSQASRAPASGRAPGKSRASRPAQAMF